METTIRSIEGFQLIEKLKTENQKLKLENQKTKQERDAVIHLSWKIIQPLDLPLMNKAELELYETLKRFKI